MRYESLPGSVAAPILFFVFCCVLPAVPRWAFGSAAPTPASSAPVAPSSGAASCTTISIDESHMGPIRDQGTSGLCFAFAAADLISHDSRRAVSPMGVGINMYRYFAQGGGDKRHRGYFRSFASRQLSAPSGPYGGWADEALYAADAHGVCSERSAPSDIRGILDPAKERPLDQHENQLAEALAFVQGGPRPADDSCNPTTAAVSRLLPGAPMESVVSILRSPDEQSRWGRLIDQTCERVPHRRVGDRLVKREARYSQTTPISLGVDQGLAMQRPVALTYDVSHLMSISGGTWDQLQGLSDRFGLGTVRATGSDHVSVVVGRRFNQRTNQCEYRVRNSWGKNCPAHFTREFGCEDGYFWLSSNTLNAVSTSSVYIRP
jgi:hypothetical protein